jgi:signal transduction histidine kinase
LDQRDLRVLSEEITRLETTTRSFLDYARPPKLVRRPTNACQEVERTLDFISHRAEQMTVRIERQLPEERIDICADADQFRQVMLNLLINALDVSPENAVIRVRVTRQPCADSSPAPTGRPGWDGFLQIEIIDQGPGLPANMGDRIFDPFTTTKESGAGLGLAICRRIVDDHGGCISAENRPEGGAVFTVRLPLGPPSPDRPA